MFINQIFCIVIICLIVLLSILIPYWWYQENKKMKQIPKIEECIKNGKPIKWKAKINADPFSMPVAYHIQIIDNIIECEHCVTQVAYRVIEDADGTIITVSINDFLNRFEPVIDE